MYYTKESYAAGQGAWQHLVHTQPVLTTVTGALHTPSRAIANTQNGKLVALAEKPSAIANRCLRTDDTSHRTRKHGSCTGHQTPRRRNGVRCNRASMRHGRLPLDVAPGGGTALHVSPRRTRGASCCSLREERHRGRHWHRHHLLTRRHLCWRSRTCVHTMVCEI